MVRLKVDMRRMSSVGKFYFNSTMVRLKVCNHLATVSVSPYFNSTMVRLKDYSYSIHVYL